MFAIEALKALHGDALLLHGLDTLIVVDGGPSTVYDHALRVRLKELAATSQGAKIDLLMVSHIDDDHISGILDLTSELVEAKLEHRPSVAYIRDLWHNSFADEILAEETRPSKALGTDMEAAVELAELVDASAALGTAMQEGTRVVLASVRQGRRLRRDANLLRVNTNRGFAEGVVLREGNALHRKRIGRFSLAVLGPSKAQLADLRKKWNRDAKRIIKSNSVSTELLKLAANLDRSVANLASLVVEVSYDGSTALLTGDARSDHILAAMAEVGWRGNDNWPIDLLKVPHHGSDRNVTREFFATVPARHYIISGDGKNGNPEPGTFEMIFGARGNEPFDLHLTYGPIELRQHSEFDWCGFKKVMNRYDGWSRLHYPGPTEVSITARLA